MRQLDPTYFVTAVTILTIDLPPGVDREELHTLMLGYRSPRGGNVKDDPERPLVKIVSRFEELDSPPIMVFNDQRRLEETLRPIDYQTLARRLRGEAPASQLDAEQPTEWEPGTFSRQAELQVSSA